MVCMCTNFKTKILFLYLLHYFKFIIKTDTIKDMRKHNFITEVKN